MSISVMRFMRIIVALLTRFWLELIEFMFAQILEYFKLGIGSTAIAILEVFSVNFTDR